MTSERRLAANHRNAMASTGPKSKTGKRRSAGNSHKHGLSRRVELDDAQLQHVSHLTGKIAAGSSCPYIRKHAHQVATAYVRLLHIQRLKAQALQQPHGCHETNLLLSLDYHEERARAVWVKALKQLDAVRRGWLSEADFRKTKPKRRKQSMLAT